MLNNGGVFMYNDINWIIYDTTNSGIASNNDLSIAIDAQGNKWFGTQGGVSKFGDTLSGINEVNKLLF